MQINLHGYLPGTIFPTLSRKALVGRSEISSRGRQAEGRHMDVAVVGGGASGERFGKRWPCSGASTAAFASTGFDVRRDDLHERVEGAGAIIEASGIFTTNQKTASQFFLARSRAVSATANRLGVPMCCCRSWCESPQVRGYGYFAAKAEQEDFARERSDRLILVRSTQWFEFAEQNLERLRFGPVAAVPSMRLQPVALTSVAGVLAECATDRREGNVHDLAGPERMTLWQMTRSLKRRWPKPVPLIVPTSYGRAFRREPAFLGKTPKSSAPGSTTGSALAHEGIRSACQEALAQEESSRCSAARGSELQLPHRGLLGACPRTGTPLAAGGRVAELAYRARELIRCGRGGGIHEDASTGNEFRDSSDFARDDQELGGKGLPAGRGPVLPSGS